MRSNDLCSIEILWNYRLQNSLQWSEVSLKRETLAGQNPGRHPSGIPQCPQRQGLGACCSRNSCFRKDLSQTGVKSQCKKLVHTHD